MLARSRLSFAVILTLSACGTPEPETVSLEARGGNPGSGVDFNPAGDSDDNHCVSVGTDINQALGISEEILIVGACEKISTGEFYVPLTSGFVNQAGGAEDTPLVYPPGYTPSKPAPIDDFLSKLVEIRYVVNPTGKTYTFSGTSALIIVPVETLWGASGFFPDSWMSFPALVFVPRLPPLPPGSYDIDVHLVLSAEQCDGIGVVPEWNCLPGGDFLLFTQPVTVGASR